MKREFRQNDVISVYEYNEDGSATWVGCFRPIEATYWNQPYDLQADLVAVGRVTKDKHRHERLWRTGMPAPYGWVFEWWATSDGFAGYSMKHRYCYMELSAVRTWFRRAGMIEFIQQLYFDVAAQLGWSVYDKEEHTYRPLPLHEAKEV